MKNKQRGGSNVELLSALICFTLFCAVIFAIGAAFDHAACSGKWEDSGLKTKWGPVKGCIVQWPDGRWLPEDVLREVKIVMPAVEVAK